MNQAEISGLFRFIGHTDTVRLMLDHGADVNARDSDGRNALMEAAIIGDTETATLLLDRGAAVDAVDNHGRAAVMFAAENGHTDTAVLLRAAQEASELAAALPPAHDDPMDRPARRPSGTREPEQTSPSRRPRL